MVLRSSSTALRSGTPSKDRTSRPPWTRPERTVSGPRSGGSVSSTAPGANRSSGSSVRTSTVASPLMPCALPMRPTTSRRNSCDSSSEYFSMPMCAGSAQTGRFDQVDTHGAAPEGVDHGAQRVRGAPLPSDHLAEVVGVHAHLENPAATQRAVADRDLVGVFDDPLHQVFEGLFEHRRQASVGAAAGVSTVSSAFGASAFGASAFFSAFFFGVAAGFGSDSASLAAASNSAFLSAFGAATFI